MTLVLRTVMAVVVGLSVAFALVVAVEVASAVVHPIPPDFSGSIAEHVTRYPHWVLALVVPAWGATAFAATWVASRLASPLAGTVVGLLLAWAIVYNVTLLPYAWWFKVVMLGAFPFACLHGVRSGRRPAAPATPADAASPSR